MHQIKRQHVEAGAVRELRLRALQVKQCSGACTQRGVAANNQQGYDGSAVLRATAVAVLWASGLCALENACHDADELAMLGIDPDDLSGFGGK